MTDPCAWGRYDDVAEHYERFQASNGYSALAADLLAALHLTPRASLLDVGCGTGVATAAAQKVVGAGGLVVGLDISLAMLRRAAAGGVTLVVGIVPGLPFRDRRFDGVAASLVLSHVERYDAALSDMVRVLKPGGRLGVSAAAESPRDRPNVAYGAWEETAESFVGREELRQAMTRVLPCEAWLTDPAHIETALAIAGLEDVEIHQREYRVMMPTEEYLSMLDLFAYGRFLRHHLGSARWQEFRESVAAKVTTHGLRRVEYTSRYHIGVGTR